MYISIEQLELSLKKLDPINPFFGISYLAFKQLDLQIDKLRNVDITEQETSILEDYYNPLPTSNFYYIPLRSTGPKNEKRWVIKDKYSSSGLQKTRTTTFAGAFIHPKNRSNRSQWAWAAGYLSKLLSLTKGVKVPTFDLAVWMLRNRDWPEDTQPLDIVNYFLSVFGITEEETETIFDTSLPATLPIISIFEKEPITWKVLRRLIGNPPDLSPEEGGGLESLELIDVGPAKVMKLDFAPRLNIITGDNGLGKTFLLECAWWALSGSWAEPEQPAYPRSSSQSSSISFKISGSFNDNKSVPVYFDKVAQQWPLPEQKRPALPGLVIYARVDGSSMVWDPAKHYWSVEYERVRGLGNLDAIRLSQDQIWNGLPTSPNTGNRLSICNGLIRDWIDWQFIPPQTTFETFSRVLEKLSPSPDGITLTPSTPIKLPRDDRQMPRLKLPYDDVPIILLSAGMKRILSLAYLLVWTWETHKQASQYIGKPPQSKLVLIIDEIESHLHPQWQRIITPALLNVVQELEQTLDIQLIVATHSPLVMASVEPIFDEKIDNLFTLDLFGQNLEVKKIPYIKYGSINSWLTSEVFDLRRPYSVEAELALVDARNIQLEEHPNPEKIRQISQHLVENLPSIDPFWPRWIFFAEKHGVSL